MQVIFGILIVLGLPVGFALLIFFLIYAAAREDKKHKILVSTVITELVITAVVFILCSAWVLFMVGTVGGEPIEHRMDGLAWEIEHNEFYELATSMHRYECYEEPFEFLWERCLMDRYTFHYRIYSTAAENGLDEYTKKAKEWEGKLESLCNNITYPENEPYRNYFLRLAGLEE